MKISKSVFLAVTAVMAAFMSGQALARGQPQP